MSNEAVLEIPNVVIVRGAPGVRWRDDVNNGEWLPGAEYLVGDGVFHDPSSFRAILNHTASPESEPGFGASWPAYWRVVSRGGLVSPFSKQFDFSQQQNSGLLALLEDI
ncbi:hypothetical protein [Mesorhizobium sp. M0965]|uniref:hypothetical protein n=1 Tax=Mesorhizobium sp. M0965 TaxID=2957036 RepID=UPI00333A283C